MIRFGILTFPHVEPLDLVGPQEVFALTPGAEVLLVGATTAPMRSATGLILTPDSDYAACPALDVLCVPGGAGVNALMEDEASLAFLRRQAAGARFVTSVCTGALVLAAAGLLRGVRATTHWNALDLLAPFGAIPVRARVVRDGRFMSGGGVTAGIDFGLALVAALTDAATAQAIQLGIEYAPEPPFDAGDPARAPAAVVAATRARYAPTRAAREEIVRRLTGQGPIPFTDEHP